MTQDGIDVIRTFARNGSMRAEALKAYRRHLEQFQTARGTPELDFMSEVDNISPDLALRAQYRQNLNGIKI